MVVNHEKWIFLVEQSAAVSMSTANKSPPSSEIGFNGSRIGLGYGRASCLPDVGAAQQIVQVVIGRLQLPELFFQLAVDCRELLVEQLRFLLGALQLFVGRLKFLAPRHDLFVGRHELLVRGLQLR